MKQEKEETKLELQHERQARIAAEIQARKLETLSKEEGAKVQQLEDVKQKLELLLQEEKQALRDEEIGKGTFNLCIMLFFDVSFILYDETCVVCCSTKFASESITRGMGEEGATGEAAAGTAGTARNGEDEETGIRANATRK